MELKQNKYQSLAQVKQAHIDKLNDILSKIKDLLT